jgi:hypothetical protein
LVSDLLATLGRCTSNVVPSPGALLTCMVKNGSKIFPSVSNVIPPPVSATSM